MKQERGEKGKKSKMQTALPESPGQIFPPTFELRMPVILPRARFAAAPLLLRPLPTGLTSHDDERTEAQAATAGTARNAVSRPSVPAITFRPRRRQLWPSSATARALPDVLTCARPAPARRAGGRAATAGRGGGRRWVWAVKGAVRRRTDRRRRRETISVRASVWGLQNLPSREEPAAGGRPGPAPARPASGGCSGLWALGSRPATRELLCENEALAKPEEIRSREKWGMVWERRGWSQEAGKFKIKVSADLMSAAELLKFSHLYE
ncbi:uncharacterized protein LOC132657384 [Ovis aries]|uniref:uncharacterized protein LOC132657384 n=1 Tax=Ovis aries TaxID=9940 RepID=UPI002952635F|nr:uncharacterized protein LOC132657384 [Ovis aries]